MGKFDADKRQDLTGIATLTNDPIAIDNLGKHGPCVRKQERKEFASE